MRRTTPANRAWQALGVAWVALSLVHAPLPQPDFHNVRHHDDAGQVCEFHDHLLRWHPGARASASADVAVLHWHWFLPGSEDAPASDSDTEGAALHAHVPDWSAGPWGQDAPVVADAPARPDLKPAP